MGTMESLAMFQGELCQVPVRVAAREDAIFLDLANDEWQAVQIDSEGWSVNDRPPVNFRRPRALRQLPTPVQAPNGRMEELRKYVNVAEAEWRLILAWTLFALTPDGPFPVLIFRGGQGSGKSSVVRLLKALVDPNLADLRSPPRELRDLAIAASNSWLMAYDNLSTLPDWLSDAICSLATGGGFGTRELYSDGDEYIIAFKRPVLLTSIEDVASRGDLLERSLIVSLTPLSETDRRPEQELAADFQRARPGLLGELLTALAATLKELPKVRSRELMRMADFCRFGIAAEKALRWPAGSFLAAYRENLSQSHDIALDNSVLPPYLARFVEECPDHKWEGSATELLKGLNALAEDKERNDREWPKKPHTLSGKLRRLAPNLEAKGLRVTFSRDTSAARNKTIELRRTTKQGGGDASDEAEASETKNSPDAPDGLDAPPPSPAAADHWTPFDATPSRN